MIEEAIREVTEALRKADERVVYVYVRPSNKSSETRPGYDGSRVTEARSNCGT